MTTTYLAPRIGHRMYTVKALLTYRTVLIMQMNRRRPMPSINIYGKTRYIVGQFRESVTGAGGRCQLPGARGPFSKIIVPRVVKRSRLVV